MDIKFDSSGGTKYITYAINCDAEVIFTSSDPSWLKISFGNGVLTITVDEYEEQNDRSGTITPSVNGTTCPNKAINITQNKGSQPEPPPPPDCEVATVTYDFGYIESGVGPCDTSVELKIPYTATTKYTDSEQCEDEINEGFSSVTVTFDDINCEEEEETITSDYYTVTRAAGPCDTCNCTRYEYIASFPGETLELGACATSATLDVTATRKCVSPYSGEPIVYTPKVSWSKTGDEGITISSTEGTAITVSATDNCVENERTANITVTAYTPDNSPIGSTTISVTQNGDCDCDCNEWYYGCEAKYYDNGFEIGYLNPESSPIMDACGETRKFIIRSHYHCVTPGVERHEDYDPIGMWEVLDGSDFVTLDNPNNAETNVIISPNNTNKTRSFTLSFSAYCYCNICNCNDDETKYAKYTNINYRNEVVMTQAAGPCEEPDTCICDSTKVTQISNNLPYTSENNVKLADIDDVESECINRFSFTSSNSNFINSIRINNGEIIGNVTENSSENERSATITVMFDRNPCTSITITQDGKPAEGCPDYVITVTPEQLACEGGYVKFGAKLNGTDVSGVENWTWECIDYTEGGSDPGEGRTNNELDINANDVGKDIIYTFRYTDLNGCTGTITCSIAACGEEECDIIGRYGTVAGDCFCNGLSYDIWLTCNGNEIQGTRKRVTTIWDEENYGDWWDYGYASNSITKKDIISYDGDEYEVNVPLTSECYVRRVVVELYAEQDDIAGGTINFNEVSTINTMINGHGFDIGGLQQGDLSGASSVSWNPTDHITVCDDGNTDYGLNIEFPATFYDVSIGEEDGYTFTRNAVGKWACDETSDYILLTPTIVVGRHGELIIRIRVQEGPSL